MHPKEQLQQDLKTAMKAKETRRREVLRLLMAALKQIEVDEQKELSAEEVQGVLMSEAKKRREAIEEAKSAGRSEMAEQEEYELAVIETYLPKQLDRSEIESIAQEVIAEVGATTPKDMGNVMRVIMPRLKGQADGKLVNNVVRDLLS